MIIYPTIELQKGRCVSLFRGRLEEASIWHVDPVEKAVAFAEAGASWLAITDFDAVENGPWQVDLISEIIRKCRIPVQLGGGFRSLEGVSQWIDRGVGRVVIGTAAVLSPDMLKTAAKLYPDQIVLAVDVFRGKVVTNGWRMPSLYNPADFIRNFETDPLAAIIVTDIDAKVEDAEDALALVTDLAGRTRHPVIARGMARSLDDISRLKYVPNIAGAIVGTALFDRSIDLGAAIAVSEQRAEAAAPFI